MLFDVTAVLTTSVALGSVAEAFGVHEIHRHDTVLSSSENIPVSFAPVFTQSLPVSPPLPFIGPETAEQPGAVVQGTRLLEQLSLLSGTGIADYIRVNPESVTNLLVRPPAAKDVTSWWTMLDLEQRTSLRAATPQLVGNLDGISFSARDLANRTVLGATMVELENTIESPTTGRAVAENARQQLNMLQSISAALTVDGEQRRTLMTLDVTGQGRAAIVMGDLRTADYVTYLVPGMFFTIDGQMTYWSDAAARLGTQQLDWLAHFGDTRSTVATVAWIGYHTPNLTNVGSLDNAVEGMASLAGAVEGLQSIRSNDEPHVTVIAHSYGSTAALMALTEDDFEIDALALVGSPGSPAQSVSELHVRDGNVYVGEAEWDPVPNSAFFGSDPGSERYGAKSFGTNGGIDAVTGETLLRSFFHIEYFSPGTESLRNLALIGIGHGSSVSSQ